MSIKSDRWIRAQAAEHAMISPFSEKQVKEGVISYGLSSYGYDLRVADEFKIFTNVNSAIIDPKHFDLRALRHHRQRHPVRARMGRLRHPRNLQHHPAAGPRLRQ